MRPRLRKALFQEAIHPTPSTHARCETRGSGDTPVRTNSQETNSSLQGAGAPASEPPAPAPPCTWAQEPFPGDVSRHRRSVYSTHHIGCAPLPQGPQSVVALVREPLIRKHTRKRARTRVLPCSSYASGQCSGHLERDPHSTVSPLSGLEGTRREPLNTVLKGTSRGHWLPVPARR